MYIIFFIYVHRMGSASNEIILLTIRLGIFFNFTVFFTIIYFYFVFVLLYLSINQAMCCC